MNRRAFLRASSAAAGTFGTSALLAACSGAGGASGSEDGTGTLTVYSNLTGSKKEAADALYAAFEAANPGVKIELTEFGDVASSHTKLLSAIVGGTVPDVVINHYYLAPAYAGGGHLMDIDAQLENSRLSLDEFDSRFLESGMWNGGRISLPLFASSRTLMYNGDALREAGLDAAQPPTDWDGVRAWAKALTIRDGSTLERAGLMLDLPPGEYGENLFALLLWSAGGELLSSDGTKAAFNSDAGREALEFWHSLIHEDKVFDIGFTGSGGNNSFVSQAAGLTFGLNPIAYFADQEGFQFGSVPIPSKDGSGQISMSDPFSLYAFKNGKNTVGAWRFIEFASAFDAQVAFCADTYSLPANLRAQSAPEVAGIAQLTPFVEALDVALPLPVIPRYVEFWEAVSRNVEAALSNARGIAAALRDAESEVNSLLSR